jgi:hypothetical protein
MTKRKVITIKEDVEIARGVFLSKGDTLYESGKGRWTLIEAEGDDEEDEVEDEVIEEEDEKEDDTEKKESFRRRR